MKTYLFIALFLLFNHYCEAQNNTYENLVFEGAGIRGLVYSGVIKQLEEHKIMPQINGKLCPKCLQKNFQAG